MFDDVSKIFHLKVRSYKENLELTRLARVPNMVKWVEKNSEEGYEISLIKLTHKTILVCLVKYWFFCFVVAAYVSSSNEKIMAKT